MTDDRDRSGLPGEADQAVQQPTQEIPGNQRPTEEIPGAQQPTVPPVTDEASFLPPQDPQPTAVHGEGLAAASAVAGRRRGSWRSITRRRPTTRRGRGLLAALAALALLFVGGAGGFALGHADGGGRGTNPAGAVHDGDRGDRGHGENDRGNEDNDSSTTPSPTTTSPTTTSPSTSPTTAGSTTSPSA